MLLLMSLLRCVTCLECRMLRIVPQTSAAAAKRYYSAADYYSEGQEIVGRWGGRAAEWLGLHGQVSQEALEALCDNRHPGTGEQLTQRNKSERRVGYDFNFSVSKGYSLLYGLTQDPALLQAFRDAVRETMQEVEADMRTRVRKDGAQADRVTGNLAFAEFIHTTSRPVDGIPDSHLHAHCFAFNCTWDPEEQLWKAGQFGDIKRDAGYYQATFRARLAEKLIGQGYQLDCANGDFEIAGLKAAAKKFQRRTDQIEAAAKRRGITDPDRKAELGATTREKKVAALDSGELRQEWFQRLDADDQRALGAAYARQGPRTMPGEEGRAIDYAVRHLFERASVVPEKQLLAEALRHGLGRATVQGVWNALGKAPLLVAERDGQRLVTTPEVLAEERRMIAFARDGRGTRKPLGSAERPFTMDWLNDGQKAAVRHILNSCDPVILVRGAAGVGKTTLLQEAVRGIEENGKRVFAFAPSAEASRGVLRKEGFAGADTVARLLLDKALQAQVRGQVILVDEAGLLGTRATSRLFDLARGLDARVILVGDRRQHGSVERGAALRLLEEKAGLQVAEVTDIRRQRGRYKEAVALLGQGRAAEGFDALDKLGWVREVEDGKREEQLAGDYLRAIAERTKDGEPKTALVISPTHAEGERISSVIRAGLKRGGQLKGEERELLRLQPLNRTVAQRGDGESYAPGEVVQFFQNVRGFKAGERVTVTGRDDGGVRVQTAAGAVKALPLDQAGRFQLFRAGSLTLAAGDRVRVTAGGKTKDGRHRVNNGALYTVKSFSKSGDVLLDGGRVLGKGFGHLAHGYVVTSHASQGKTVDQVFVGQSAESFPASSREQWYVSVSRGRDKAVIYTSDKEALRAAVRRSDERLTATELVGDKLSRRARLLKHVEHLRRWANVARQTAERIRSAARPRAQERGQEHGR
jgi:conjugative relaxase-like TrwC/TraI family protein